MSDATKVASCECGRDIPPPLFDADKARQLNPYDVRKAFPRLEYLCECGRRTIVYASFEHYLAGDW